MAFLNPRNRYMVPPEGDPPELPPQAPPPPQQFPVIDPSPNAPVDPGAGGEGGGGGGGGYGGLSIGQPHFNFPELPGFKYPKFKAPTLADAENEPGYALRSQAGTDALERSAAARGVLRTGGTLKDLATWNQNFASSEYSNVFNRALGVYDRQYRGAYDAFAPQMARYNLEGNAAVQAALAQYQREYGMYALSHQGGGGAPDIPPPPPAPDVSAYGHHDPYEEYRFP